MMVLSIFTDFCSWWPIWWILPAILGWLLGRMLMMKWKTRTEELEGDVANWRSKYSDLDGEYTTAKKRNTELDSHLSMERGKYKELDTKYQAYTTRFTDLEDQLSTSDAKYGTLNAQYKSFDTRHKELENNYNNLLAKHKKANEDLEACQAKGKKLNDDLKAAADKLAKAEADVKNAEAKAAAAKASAEKAAASRPSASDATKIAGAAGVAGVAGAAGFASAPKKVEQPKSVPTPKAEPQSAGDGKWSKLKTNNLEIIEGIGPKMNEVLNDNGITSWAMLASKNPAELRSILDKYGDKYKMIDPSDWPRQAAFANGRDWDGLIKYQSDDGSPAKARSVLVRMGIYKDDRSNDGASKAAAATTDDGTAGPGAWAKLKTNNLQIIEGIGPKMNEVLNDNGISSWAVLSGKSFDQLRAILDKYQDKYRIIDPSDWPAQAGFANKRDWEGLFKHQSDDGSASKAKNLLIKLGIMKGE